VIKYSYTQLIDNFELKYKVIDYQGKELDSGSDMLDREMTVEEFMNKCKESFKDVLHKSAEELARTEGARWRAGQIVCMGIEETGEVKALWVKGDEDEDSVLSRALSSKCIVVVSQLLLPRNMPSKSLIRFLLKITAGRAFHLCVPTLVQVPETLSNEQLAELLLQAVELKDLRHPKTGLHIPIGDIKKQSNYKLWLDIEEAPPRKFDLLKRKDLWSSKIDLGQDPRSYWAHYDMLMETDQSLKIKH
jgi:hypothetical protein